ncbi:hypothetical protein RFI_05145, partial [Reticulomyxa filosa]
LISFDANDKISVLGRRNTTLKKYRSQLNKAEILTQKSTKKIVFVELIGSQKLVEDVINQMKAKTSITLHEVEEVEEKNSGGELIVPENGKENSQSVLTEEDAENENDNENEQENEKEEDKDKDKEKEKDDSAAGNENK